VIAAFSSPQLSPAGKFVYALVTYVLVGMTYTLVNLPYSSLTAALTQDIHERSSLAAFRMVFAILGAATVAIATVPLTKLEIFPDQRAGFQAVMAVYAVLAMVICWAAFLSTKERVTASSREAYKLKDIFKILSTNKPLFFLGGATLFSQIAGTMRMASKPGNRIAMGTNDVVKGYNVTYRYDGAEKTVRMDNKPASDRLPVVDGQLVTQTAAAGATAAATRQ